MNVIFYYMYRDGGNFKNPGKVVFSNKKNYPLTELDEKIRETLFDYYFFDTFNVDIPDVFFDDDYDDEIDHDWHEYVSISETNESITDERDIEDFIKRMEERSLNDPANIHLIDPYWR